LRKLVETEVRRSVLINADPDSVWKTITEPENISAWISEKPIKIISEWKLGSGIVFESEWNGRLNIDKGIILELKKPEIFRYSFWTHISRMPDIPENYAVIEFILEEHGTQTLLSVIHSNLIMEAGYEHANFFWIVALNEIKKLAEHISNSTL
jgi:uncharacterized protein YndB with AHSA1/START domain